MNLTIKRVLCAVVLVLGWMAVAYAHEPAAERNTLTQPTWVTDTRAKADASNATTTKPETRESANSTAPEALLPQTEPKEGGGGCLRASCNCTSSNHGNPYCSTTGGDCPNHPGLLCIWP